MQDNLADRRLRLRFDFALPCFPGARQNILDGLTTGLAAEVAKWENPVAYLSARLEELCITASPLAADLSDRETDSQRSNPELQALLRELFDTAGLQEIPVKQREAFQPAYHSVVQIVPGRSPEDQSQTVAQVVARGFLRRGQVFRKASVVLYK
jgi:molecular chaperone GrpE (heat shock protein)